MLENGTRGYVVNYSTRRGGCGGFGVEADNDNEARAQAIEMLRDRLAFLWGKERLTAEEVAEEVTIWFDEPIYLQPGDPMHEIITETVNEVRNAYSQPSDAAETTRGKHSDHDA